MTPLAKRRLANFKANKRGYYAFWLFIILLVLSFLAEFIANDKPILVYYKEKLYFPVTHAYTETDYGGIFETEADYRDPYLIHLIEKNGWMIWPIVTYAYTSINYTKPAPSPPSFDNWLGTDDQGRDVLARVIYGFRLSVVFGILLTVSSSLIGIAAGAIQGYVGGWTDLIFQRFIEIWSGLPELYLLIILASIVEPSFSWLLGILLLFSWLSLVGVVRAEFLKARNFEYVKAAKALGVKEYSIIFRHLLPNATISALTFMPFILSRSITALTALDYLGLGLPPSYPSLGELLRQGKDNLYAPWLGISGFIIIALMLTLLVFIGEAVRDAYDPRKNFTNGAKS